MILLYRFIPFTLACAFALGATALFWFPHAVSWVVGLTVAVCTLLLVRLAHGRTARVHNGVLIGMPLLLILSTFGVLLFLEDDLSKTILTVCSAALLFFYSEHLFTYVHLPAAYQLHALEHLGLVLNLATSFLAAVSLYGARLFLQLPLWMVAPAYFFLTLFVLFSTLWMCKVERSQLIPYSFGGSLILTEVFVALSYLPSGFFPNAALITLFLYVFLGIARAHFLRKLSPTVVRRYAASGALLALLVAGTTHWV